MVGASTSLKDYLKRYGGKDEEEEKKKKRKKKKVKPEPVGVLVVDEDPVWQKPVKLEEDDDDSADEEQPVVDEDIEVKRMKRLELLRSRRPIGAISEDGSGWVSVADTPKISNLKDQVDISPPRKKRIRNDTPSPEPEPSRSSRENNNLSPHRQPRRRHHTPSPEPDLESSKAGRESEDLSPPRQRRRRHHTPSPEPERKESHSNRLDLKKLQHNDQTSDVSPPRRHRPNLPPDLSPPRRGHRTSPSKDDSRASKAEDLSPPRKGRSDRMASRDTISSATDLSPPRNKMKDRSSQKEQPKVGLMSGRDMGNENAKAEKNQRKWFQDMDPLELGRGAQGVYRDKVTGAQISKEEFLKSKIKEEPKEIKLEWGKGLAQKREAEERQLELELEKDKPFARTRDDPELDKMLKGRLRWGDPMAHLVKNNQLDTILPDLGDDEKMKESGFVIPQDIPNHSWLKRRLEAAPNRYGIKPGRHWDGVDRSTGYEKAFFKRVNEKQATEREAYLWSVSEM